MPSPDVVKKALSLIKRVSDYEYFFANLESPDWIMPLWEAGMFHSPYEPIKEGEDLQFPPWPESSYLARMGSLAPSIVQEIAFKIPNTENVRIHEDLIDAALNMPVEYSVEFVPKAKLWLQTPYLLRFPEKLGSLVSHLAKGGQVEAALDLARTLLKVLPDPRVAEETDEDQTYRPSPEPRPRFDKWDYEEIIKKNIPDMLETAAQESIELLCDILDSAIHFSRRSEEEQGPEDYSYIWRSEIGGAHDHYSGIKDLLVTAVRDASEQIVRADGTQLPLVVSILEERKWHVFKRISLYLMSLFPEMAQGLITEHLLDRRFLDPVSYENEYGQLLRERFLHLSPTEQAGWLSLIEQGPPIKSNEEKTRTQEEIEETAIRWRQHHLSCVVDKLPAEWSQRYQEWINGLIVRDTFVHDHGAEWVGPTSPKSVEDLKTMAMIELMAFLQSWHPPNEFFAPSPEGLGRQLTTAVAEDPTRFSQEASLFQKLHPTYVRSIIQGLEEGCKAKKTFDWVAVLQLCLWIVKQPREALDRKLSGNDVDPDWGWTRKAIARLLTAGFESTAFEIPYTFRQEAWSILEPLTRDPDPTPKHEVEYGGPNMAPVTLSINTVRGDAIHTLIRHALWIRRHLESFPDAKEKLARGFNEMPEVGQVLDEHLEVERDPSLAVRSVYGQWFPWLVLLDAEWATQNVSRIFPQEEDARGLRNAAWETYVTFCRAYDSVFEILQDEYAWSVDHLPEGSDSRDSDRMKEKLVEHLAVFYLRGKLRLDEPNGILTRFYQNVPSHLHAYFIEFIGRDFYNYKADISPEMLDLTKTLWEHRFEACSSSSQSQELIPFGWWFASGKFDDPWAISQLIKVLKITGKAEFGHHVVERLDALASTMPGQVIEALELMIIGDKKGWGITGWRRQIRLIIKTVQQSDNREAREAAIDLVHRLGALGYLEFRDLLPKA